MSATKKYYREAVVESWLFEDLLFKSINSLIKDFIKIKFKYPLAKNIYLKPQRYRDVISVEVVVLTEVK